MEKERKEVAKSTGMMKEKAKVGCSHRLGDEGKGQGG